MERFEDLPRFVISSVIIGIVVLFFGVVGVGSWRAVVAQGGKFGDYDYSGGTRRRRKSKSKSKSKKSSSRF
jgi:uncharacterized protein YqfA (UPF0365 family)